MRTRHLLPAAAVLAAVSLGTVADAGAPGDARRTNDCATRSMRGRDLSVVGLAADGSLVCFEEDRPGRLTTIGRLTGLAGDTSIVGMDFRPANNVLYAVGNAGGVYTVDTATAVATKVSQLNVALQGTSFGVDFNPTVDRLRIISDTGQNLRANVDDGTTAVDGTLNIPGTTPVNPATGVTGAAYTNNDADPNTATTLFDIDTTNDNTVIQAPANAGSLSPTGKLLVDAGPVVGFDIYSALRNGTTTSLRALASLSTAGGTGLYAIDLLTGRASGIGTFPVAIVDLAIPTAQR